MIVNGVYNIPMKSLNAWNGNYRWLCNKLSNFISMADNLLHKNLKSTFYGVLMHVKIIWGNTEGFGRSAQNFDFHCLPKTNAIFSR